MAICPQCKSGQLYKCNSCGNIGCRTGSCPNCLVTGFVRCKRCGSQSIDTLEEANRSEGGSAAKGQGSSARVVGVAILIIIGAIWVWNLLKNSSSAPSVQGAAQSTQSTQSTQAPSTNTSPSSSENTSTTKPSFNCSQITSTAEQLICGDSALAELDNELARIYQGYLGVTKDPESLRKKQRAWLTAVRDSCDNVECLNRIYMYRIQEFRNMQSSEN